jgi:hypothetical protein
VIDTLIEIVGGIEYHRTPTEYEARLNGLVICNKDLDRLKQDAPLVMDLINTWKQDQLGQD